MQPMLNSFQRKHRERVRTRWFLNLLVMGLVGTAGYFAYQFGVQQEAARSGQKAIELQRVEAEREVLRQQVVEMEAQALESTKRLEEAERKYREEVPDDNIRNIIKAAQEKIKGGVSADRLLALVEAAGAVRNCGQRETKRFILPTPVGREDERAWAKFASGAVTVTGEGVSAVNANRQPEAWFDPKKPVKLRFILPGGRASVAEGVLPLTHTIIDENSEYRFSLTPGTSRGFIDIVGVSCDYPQATVAPPR